MVTTHDHSTDPAPPLVERTLPSELDAAATTYDCGFHDGRQWLGWAEFTSEAARAATILSRLGVGAGDVVATHLPSSWAVLVLHAATARLGAVWLPVPMTAGSYELRALLERAAASVLVILSSYRGRDQTEQGRVLLRDVTSLRHVVVWGDVMSSVDGRDAALLSGGGPRGGDQGADLPNGVVATDPLALLASSGTTSQHPKICIHTHGGLLGNAAVVVADSGFCGTDTVLTAAPVNHAFGLLAFHMALLTRAGFGVIDRWDAQRFLDLLHATRATTVFAVPAQLSDLLELADRGAVLPRLREIRTGGAPISKELVRALGSAFQARVTVQWGMTEVGAGIYTRPGDPPDVVSGTIGRPCQGGRVRVVAADGQRAPVDQVGELQFWSPYLFRGYLGDKEATRAAFVDGWLRTGDLASITPEGAVRYHGRRGDVINRGGLKYNVGEIENLLADLLPGREYAIVARPDKRLGQRACLVAVSRSSGDLTVSTIANHLSAKGVARYKWPEELILVDALPTTFTGKIARGRLARQLAAGATGVPTSEDTGGTAS